MKGAVMEKQIQSISELSISDFTDWFMTCSEEELREHQASVLAEIDLDEE
jgi:hypothetical protein